MRRPLLLALLLCLAASPASAQWTRIESPNFVVFGEIGEKRTREYAAEFERFREALGRVTPGAALRTAVPAVVFIFRDQRSFAPYRPMFNGKPVTLSGYFAGGSDLSVIMLPATDREAAFRTVFHEYSHLVVANVARALPAWLSEGLAEYYSTFDVDPDGRRAVLGKLIESHLVLLNTGRMLTLEELLTVERDSPMYNEGARRSTFYAQSWALVHMLLNGEPQRTQEFDRYVALVASGRSALDAWHEVFPSPKIFDGLRAYVSRGVLTGFAFTFARQISPAAFTVSTPALQDVLAALGDLLRRVRPESAGAHMAAVKEPATPFVDAVRGLIEVDQNDYAKALPLLSQAARASNDWLVLYRAATGLERIAQAESGEHAKAAAAAGLAALDRVLAAKPELPHAVALRALLLGPGDEGIAAIQRARSLVPGREHYAIWQAEFHVSRGEFANARQLLAPLLSSRYPADIRDYAQIVMQRAVSEEEARTRAAARRAASNDPAPAPGDRPARPGQTYYVFRELQPGEQRIEGVLERIECPRTGIVLHVRQEARTLRFTAEKFDGVEFITYDETLSGSVNCGTRTPPDRVYVTFTVDASKAADGRAVAVEFVPKSQ